MNFPDKKYKIIYADPPWEYTDTGGTKNARGMAKSFFNTMSLDEIKSLPIQNISDENCWLFLWATDPLMDKCIEVVKAWGFQYKNFAFDWIKETENGKEFVGMGHYTRANPEYCLLGIKGKVEVLDHTIRKIIHGRVREHSKKPDIVRNKIIQLCGDLPRIELFARTKVHGWDVWGNDEKLNNTPLEEWL
ncbi:MAG TPA: MT-A70 family methyltransferase [Nitrosarchaeum sp.]|nr:MT-A70 family methyltransferase [Nitrosarchaeum sp.]